MAHDDSARRPDFRHMRSRQTSISVTSLLVNLRRLVVAGFVASTEFLGNVISFFSGLGTVDGLAGVELGGGTIILVGV